MDLKMAELLSRLHRSEWGDATFVRSAAHSVMSSLRKGFGRSRSMNHSTSMQVPALTALVLMCSVPVACSDDDESSASDGPATNTEVKKAKPAKVDLIPYPVDSVSQVSVSLPEVSWDLLCHEGEDLSQHSCDYRYSYNTFDASGVAVDATAAVAGTVRKKGTLGSLSLLRPALKIDFDPDAFLGATLNNNRQDPTSAHQCLTYGLFARAGLPSPSCSLARVFVNGRDLGIYTHVEEIKKPFLRRVFGNDKGNLYEGGPADFTAARRSQFDLKTNGSENDTSDLDRLISALAVEDSQLEAALGKVIDLDEFFTFWAMETLVGHRDGYTGNHNNFYVYRNPTDDLFHFIVYGADTTFVSGTEFTSNDQAISVFVKGAVNARIYAHPELRLRYQQRLRELIGSLWNESELLAEVQHWASLAQTPDAVIAPLTAFVQTQRAALLKELDNGVGRLDTLENPCRLAEVAPTRGNIEVSWSDGTTKPGAAIVHDLVLPFEGSNLTYMDGTTQGYAAISPTDPSQVDVRLIGAQQGTGRILVVGFRLPTVQFADGTYPLYAVESVGGVAELFPPALTQGPVSELLGSGTYTLSGAAMQVGSIVKLSWSGSVVPWLPPAPAK